MSTIQGTTDPRKRVVHTRAVRALTGGLVGSTIRSVRLSESGRGEERDSGGGESSVVPVGPVVPVRAPRALPAVLIVGVLVGAAAFVAGLQLGTARPADTRPAIVPSAPASSVVAPSPSVPPSPSASLLPADPIAGPPYASAFADGFRPPDLFAQYVGEAGCVSHNEQSQQAIGVAEYVLARTWTTFCPLEPASRKAFVKSLVVALSEQIPGSRWSETSDGADSTLALFPYTQNGFIGTVTLSADAAGSGFEIVISLQERRAP
jgi:hypothetical protein